MPESDLDETLVSIVKQSPARVLESYYWSEEEGLLEFTRGFLRLPAETQAALKTLLQVSPNLKAIHAAFDEQGQLTLTSGEARKPVTYMIGVRDAALQAPVLNPCAVG